MNRSGPEEQLRKAIAKLDLDKLATEEAKSEVVRLPVSPRENQEIQASADALGLSVSAYLLGLHRHLMLRMKGEPE